VPLDHKIWRDLTDGTLIFGAEPVSGRELHPLQSSAFHCFSNSESVMNGLRWRG
jgi:hypothetical protein